MLVNYFLLLYLSFCTCQRLTRLIKTSWLHHLHLFTICIIFMMMPFDFPFVFSEYICKINLLSYTRLQCCLNRVSGTSPCRCVQTFNIVDCQLISILQTLVIIFKLKSHYRDIILAVPVVTLTHCGCKPLLVSEASFLDFKCPILQFFKSVVSAKSSYHLWK